MKIKNLTVVLLLITVILTKNLAFGCPGKSKTREYHTRPTKRTLDPMQNEDGGFLNKLLKPFGSFIRKLSPLFAPGIQRVLTW